MIHLRICEFEIFQCHPKNWANKISKHSKDAKISGIFLLVCTFHHLADVENTSFDDALNRLDLAEGQNLDVFVMLLFPIFFDDDALRYIDLFFRNTNELSFSVLAVLRKEDPSDPDFSSSSPAWTK